MFCSMLFATVPGKFFYSNIYATQDLKPDNKIETNVQQYSNTYVSSGGIKFFSQAVPKPRLYFQPVLF